MFSFGFRAFRVPWEALGDAWRFGSNLISFGASRGCIGARHKTNDKILCAMGLGFVNMLLVFIWCCVKRVRGVFFYANYACCVSDADQNRLRRRQSILITDPSEISRRFESKGCRHDFLTPRDCTTRLPSAALMGCPSALMSRRWLP